MPISRPEIAAAVQRFEAQKRRFDAQIAELRAMLPDGCGQAATPQPAKRKRRLSAVGRRAIAEAARKRWAKNTAPARKKTAEKKAFVKASR